MPTPEDPGEAQSVGQRLREARQRAGLNLGDVERQTRIPRQYLQALEADQYGVLPAPVYARGFLRNYARFLGLDENELLLGLPLGDQEPSVLPIVPPRRNSGLWIVAGLAFIAGLGLWAVLGLGLFQAVGDLIDEIGGDDPPAPTPIVVTSTPVPNCDVLAQRGDLTDTERQFFADNCVTPTPATPTPLPHRGSCDAIRGTAYESPEERTFFLENCLTPPAG